MSETEDQAPETREPHVQQALNELENGVVLGQDDAVGAARNRLAAAGVDPNEAEEAIRARLESPAKKRKAAAADSGDPDAAKTTPPQGRTAAPKSTTEASKPTKATPADKSKA